MMQYLNATLAFVLGHGIITSLVIVFTGFLINKGKASCKDMLRLIEEIQYRVRERYNVDIETEVRIIGEQ